MNTTMEDHLFLPRDDRAMLVEYEELAEMEEFNPLNDTELRFVWFYASPTSPLLSTIPEDRKRAYYALQLVYKTGIPADLRDQSLSTNFEPRIAVAIQRMKNFKLSARKNALEAFRKALDRTLEMLNEEPLLENDSKKKVEYMNMVGKAEELVPKLIHKIEAGFGYRQRAAGANTLKDGEKLVDNILSGGN